MSSERNERKWVQYVNAYEQKSEYVNPPPLPSMSQAAVEAEREVTNYFAQVDAAEEQMRGRFQRGGCAFHDSVVVEVSDLDTSVAAAIESKCAAIRMFDLEGIDPYAACAMTEEEYVAALNEREDAYLALGGTCVQDLPTADASCRNNNVTRSKMSSLRLKATGERLVWKDDVEAAEVSLCRESVGVDTWFATISDNDWSVWKDDGDGHKILGGEYTSLGVATLRAVCEDALITAGVAEYIDDEEPFPSD